MTMRRAAACRVVALLAATASAAGCSGKAANRDSAVQADRAAATVDTSGSGGTAGTEAPLRGGVGGMARSATPVRSGASGTPASAASVRPPAGADTLRGVIRVVGASIDAHPVIRPNGGGAMVSLGGPNAATLGRLSGIDVWVSGTREGNGAMIVDRFLVRVVGGVPAMDGTLTERDGRLAILMTGEPTEKPIANPPAALRARVGQRVWLTGSLATGAVTFGTIDAGH